MEHEYTEEELSAATRKVEEELIVATEVIEADGGVVDTDTHIVWTDDDRNPQPPAQEEPEGEKKE